jgi:hypothetical protein
MKRVLIAFALVAAAGLLLTPSSPRAQSVSLPLCATDGDKDRDGVPDVLDADETDSCLASSSGYEDCTTGVGDGIPDCQ